MLFVLLSVSVLLIASVTSTCIDTASVQQACPANEVYVPCLLAHCQPKTCLDLGKNIPCPGISEPCTGGCVCNNGYVRNDTGTCVEEYTCPTPTCPVNEHYISCIDGQCQPKHCSDIGHSIACPSFRGYCPGGCLCDEGYLRGNDKICIKQEDCPNPCPKPYTHFTSCMPICEVSSCRQLRNPPPANCASFQLECHIGCACDDGYLWDDQGECVLVEQCDAGYK